MVVCWQSRLLVEEESAAHISSADILNVKLRRIRKSPLYASPPWTPSPSKSQASPHLRQEQIDGSRSASTPTSIRGQDSEDDSTDLRLLQVAYSVAYSTAGSCLYRSPSISLSSILGGGKRELMGTGRGGRVLLSGNCDEYFTQPARSYFADKMPPRGFMHEGGGDLEGLMVKRGREQEKGC